MCHPYQKFFFLQKKASKVQKFYNFIALVSTKEDNDACVQSHTLHKKYVNYSKKKNATFFIIFTEKIGITIYLGQKEPENFKTSMPKTLMKSK